MYVFKSVFLLLLLICVFDLFQCNHIYIDDIYTTIISYIHFRLYPLSTSISPSLHLFTSSSLVGIPFHLHAALPLYVFNNINLGMRASPALYRHIYSRVIYHHIYILG